MNYLEVNQELAFDGITPSVLYNNAGQDSIGSPYPSATGAGTHGIRYRHMNGSQLGMLWFDGHATAERQMQDLMPFVGWGFSN